MFKKLKIKPMNYSATSNLIVPDDNNSIENGVSRKKSVIKYRKKTNNFFPWNNDNSDVNEHIETL